MTKLPERQPDRARRPSKGIRRFTPLAAGAALWIHPAAAQQQSTVASIQTTATVSDNANGAPKGFELGDALLSVRPSLHFVRRGTRLSVDSDLAADMVTSAKNSRPDRILPSAQLNARGELIERIVSLDAGVNVRQVEDNAFGPRVEVGSTRNTRTAGTYRISPALEYETSSGMATHARYEVVRTRYAGTTEGDLDTRDAVIRVGVKPVPVGAALEWGFVDSDYGAANADNNLRTEHLTAVASVSAANEWVLGASVGRERSKFGAAEQSDTIYGLRAYWSPGPRTELSAAVDRRFFGTGWNASARHRTPRISFVLRTLREPSTAGNGGIGDGLAHFLDAILTTRIPDVDRRNALVGEMIDQRGLRDPVVTESAATGAYPQLRTRGELAWIYLASRTTLTLSVYGQELRQLTRADGTTFGSVTATEDTRQRGASFGWNRQLASTLSLDVGIQWSRIEGLGLRVGEQTRERVFRAGLTRPLSPRTTASLGATVRRVSSNASNVNAFDETAAFAGLSHRF